MSHDRNRSLTLFTLVALIGACSAPPPAPDGLRLASPSRNLPAEVGFSPLSAPLFEPVEVSPDSPTPPVDAPVDDSPAPPTWDGPLTLADDDALSAFCDAGFDSVLGDLTVTGAVTDLTPLSCLAWVRGDLRVELAPGLARVEGLALLTDVGGDLVLGGLASARELGGFDVLSEVGGDVVLTGLPQATVFPTFPALHTIGGDLVVDGAPRLLDWEPLPSLTSVNGVGFRDAALQRLGGFDLLVRAGALSLRWLPDLDSVEGLPLLQEVSGDFVVERLGGAEALTLPASLAAVGGEVRVFDNPSYVDLEELLALEAVGRDLVIDANPSLGSAYAASVGAALEPVVAGHVVLGRNGE